MVGVVNGAVLSETCRSITGNSAAAWETTRQKTSSPCAPTAIELSTGFRNKCLCRSVENSVSSKIKVSFSVRNLRTLHQPKSFGVDLQETVYALDATTIDLRLSLFPWAPFRSAMAAIKLHTLLDLRGNIPTFIHVSDGKMHEVNLLEAIWLC